MGKSKGLILVVEDEPNNRELAIKILNFSGYTTIYAVNGQEAVEAVERKKPDLVLMDLSLPIMDGWEATRLIRDLPQGKKLTIIAVTAHAMGGDRESALQAGCTDYISKPYSPKQLLEVIDRYLIQAGRDEENDS